MKFYSYSNENEDYTKAVSIENVRYISINEGYGHCSVRFYLAIHYSDGTTEEFPSLYESEVKRLYRDVLDALNKAE